MERLSTTACTPLVRRVVAQASLPVLSGTVAISMPAWIGPVEWREVLSCIRSAMPVENLVPVSAPLAAALGARPVPPDGQPPQLVVDVGHHLAEAAIVADGEALRTESAWTGGAEASAILAGHLLASRALDPGHRSFQRALRSASHPMNGNIAVRGVDARTGEQRVVLLHSDEVAAVLTPVFDVVVDVARRAIDAMPATIAAAAINEGPLLTGGMAKVHGLRGRLADAFGVEVDVVDAPTQSVVAGLRRAADNHASRPEHRRRNLAAHL